MELLRQVGFARHAHIRGFPALARMVSDELHAVPVDYRDFTVTLSEIRSLLMRWYVCPPTRSGGGSLTPAGRDFPSILSIA